MYTPKLYEEKDQEKIIEFIRANNFGILVNTHEGIPVATHVPFHIHFEDGKLILSGHISKANPQWKTWNSNPVLVIFQGAHAYVSPSWYDHENVPTWNYSAAHVSGQLKILEGQKRFDAMSALVDQHETGRPNAISMQKLSENTLKEMDGVVVFEIITDKIEAIRKHSQNRDQVNFDNILKELEKDPDEMARKTASNMKNSKL